jgi:hypothetical protein
MRRWTEKRGTDVVHTCPSLERVRPARIDVGCLSWTNFEAQDVPTSQGFVTADMQDQQKPETDLQRHQRRYESLCHQSKMTWEFYVVSMESERTTRLHFGIGTDGAPGFERKMASSPVWSGKKQEVAEMTIYRCSMMVS